MKLMELVILMTNYDFATLYISNDIDENYKIKYHDIFNEIVKYINSKNVNVNVVNSTDKKGRNHISSFIDSIVNSDLQWRLKINIENSGNYKKLYLTLSPEFKNKKILGQKETEDVGKKDIEFFKNKIGYNINITVDKENITLKAFSYSQENKISIKNWDINCDQNVSENYNNFINNTSSLLKYIGSHKTFEFRIVNLTRQPNNNTAIKSIISLLNRYGTDLNLSYDQNSYTNIKTLPNNPDIINIILINKNDGQSYDDSKEFFLEHNIPFQHIKIDGNILTASYAQNMMILEIYKKTHIQDFYLSPDHFLNEPIAGFIYLDVDSLHDHINNQYSNYLTISYIFSENLNYSDEKVLSFNNIKIHSKRDYINIIDVNKTADFIVSRNEIIKRYTGGSFHSKEKYFNIIVTKQLNKKSMNSLITVLNDKNIHIGRVYYISNYRLRFADNNNYYNSSHTDHYYKIIGKNMAVIKMATNKFLFPQLFSTFVKILYPSDAEISYNDIKNIIWLTKKRIYRAYSLKNMTLLEPVSIKNQNIKFITRIKGGVNINLFI